MSETPEKRAVVVMPARMQSSEFLRQDWVVTAEEGTLIEDVLDPGYWTHMAAQMEPYARVDVRIDTGEWFLELLVLQVGRNWAKVHVLHKHQLEAFDPEAGTGSRCEVKWGGPSDKYRVVRKADNEIISKGHSSRGDAEAAMAQYEKTVATT